jgi:cobaltochelatase CobN
MENSSLPKKNKKNKLLLTGAVLCVLSVLYVLYVIFASSTRIALVNYPNFQAASIAKSTDDRFIRIEEVPLDKLDRLKNKDAILVFGMGIRITEEQREVMQKAADKGIPYYTDIATNPANDINNLDSTAMNQVRGYLENGGKNNYRNLMRYIRYNLDRKVLFTAKPDSVADTPDDMLYHVDDDFQALTVEDYLKFYREANRYREAAPRVAIVGGMSGPQSGNNAHVDSLITSLEHSGINVFPVASMKKRLDYLKEIDPDLVIYLPHGRVMPGSGDLAVEWLKSRNIPLLCPLTVLRPEDEWLEDKMGMTAGMLSQSVAVPEIDGGILSYALNAEIVDEEGYYLFRAIPQRLDVFVQTVKNYLNLKKKPNSEKKVTIYYFRGAGQNALVASGMEVIPSLYHFLKRLQAEGYRVDNLPADVKQFGEMIHQQGVVLGPYAKGAFDQYVKDGHPALVERSTYESWAKKDLAPGLYEAVVKQYGEAPGEYMSTHRDGKDYLAIARLEFGNVAVLPQPLPGLGENSFKLVHGVQSAPPHTYIASYLWGRHAFHADAMIHFGTHGSLEFTPQKQVALSSYDWPDQLVGPLPHFYFYTIANVGEGTIAKRRSYATLITYLTPPFMESDTRNQFRDLSEKMKIYYNKPEGQRDQASLEVKQIALKMGLHRDLELDSIPGKPYTEEDMERLENFAEEIANEKMNGQLYTLGVPYETDKIGTSVIAMSADPVAYSLAALDRSRGKVTDKELKRNSFFTVHYLDPAKQLVTRLLNSSTVPDDQFLCRLTGISPDKLIRIRSLSAPDPASRRSAYSVQSELGKTKTSSEPSGVKSETTESPEEVTKEEKKLAYAVLEVERTITNVARYRTLLQESPEAELQTAVNALNGGYVSPSPGGDPIANPNTIPTGRNLYSVNAEATPSESAWDKAVTLVDETLDQYRKRHGEYPKKVSYTFWSSEFIETEGATIAQVLYMLGVEPVRDVYGRVSDLRLIPAEELDRPRIDVVVQTSGQFRDLAASRLMLITRAVDMAANADDSNENFVRQGTINMEKALVEKGISPKEARELSGFRVFGGVNGNYGTGIMGMVESGDRWENEQQVAETYINNMGAIYGTEKDWGDFREGLLESALQNTDVVIQPRQSNTWGALSLDHVYEFMGGMNLAVRHVTGKDPDAYFSDYRNRNKVKIQEIKEAMGVEARTTIFNPAYIREQTKGGASSAEVLAETIRNTYGWNVMKPKSIDSEIWDRMYQVYVKDVFNLNVPEFFRRENPAALQEITSVMLETARKGYWKASREQVQATSQLLTQLVTEFKPGCSGFVCDNAKLQEFVAANVGQAASAYLENIGNVREVAGGSGQDGVVMKKESLSQKSAVISRNKVKGVLVITGVLAVFVVLIFRVKRKQRKRL